MNILLAIDGTEQSDAATDLVLKLASGEDCNITVISIVDLALPLSFEIYEGYLPSTAEIEKTAKENAGNVLQQTAIKLKEKFPESKILTEVLIGAPESRIVEKAEDINADLIVVGSHGYNRWERLLLGSVSDSVAHHASCSVLIARKKG